MYRLVAVAALTSVFSAATVSAIGTDPGPPPIYVNGARAVDIRDADGGMSQIGRAHV